MNAQEQDSAGRNSRTGRCAVRRWLTVAALALSVAGGVGAVAAAPAQASVMDHQLRCPQYVGIAGRRVSLDLVQYPSGTTVAAYLYKWSPNGTWQSQNQLDWATVSLGGLWEHPAMATGNSPYIAPWLATYATSGGYYTFNVRLWNSAGAYLGDFWTNNYCTF